MPEIRTPYQAVQVDYVCDNCSDGMYRSTGLAFPVSPPKFEHSCKNCGDKKSFLAQYPFLAHEASSTHTDYPKPDCPTIHIENLLLTCENSA